ncbi:MAG: DUF177 domain-containing protein [Acetobacteraceae bacterium]
MTPEISRPVAVDRIGPAGIDVTVKATPAECDALAQRMQLPAVQSLTCRVHLARDAGGTLFAHGHLVARVVQTCVITLDDFEATVEDRFVLRCVPEGEETEDDDPETPDEIVSVGGMLDVGEVAAEQLALVLDPYPRAPGAELPEMPDDPMDHGLAALGKLKRH